VDGESFIHLTAGESGTPRVQLFEGHLIATPPKLEGEKTVVDGFRLAPSGRPVSLFVGTEDKFGSVTVTEADEKPADSFVHILEPSRPGQVRGLPFVYPVINLLHDLEDLQILEMKAAKQAAKVAIVRKNDTGEMDAEEILRNGGSVVPSTDPEREAFYRETFGGEEVVLRNGDELEQFRSDRPSIVTQDYWRMLRAEVCTGVGIPHVIVYPDSMQGTVYRGSLDMSAAWFQARHLVLADAWRRVYEYVIGWARFNVPELRDAPADWKNVRIHPPKSVNVDVGRNSAALLSEIAAGIKSPQGVIGADGRDWREVYDECAEAQKYAADLGLNLAVGAIPPSETPEPVASPTNRLAFA